jgi:hypothetical protein
MTPSELLARLDTRLRLLTSGRRAGPDRHRTLRATVGWSYDLLSPGQQLLFQRLSVFTGPFDLAAAEAVAAYDGLDTVDVDRLLGDLVERSMVTVDPGPLGRRFRLLETLRQFAADHLAAQGDAEEAARRHARWCRDQVARIHGLLTGPGEVEGVARLGQLWPNLRTAVDWACTTGDAALADALVRPIVPEIYLRRQAEIGDWAERILELIPRGNEAGIVFWLAWAASRHIQTSHHDAYERVVRRHGHAGHPLIRFTHAYLYEDGPNLCEWSPAAASWLRQQGEHHAGDLIELFGVVAGLMTTGRFEELDAVAATMADRFRAAGAPTLLHFTLGMLGYSARFQGRHEEATRLFAMSADIDLPVGIFSAHRAVEARAVFDQGERSRAFRMLRDDADALLDTDYVDSARIVAVEFVNMMAAVDRLVEAARVLAYLDTTEGFGVLARDTLVADAVASIAAAPQVTDGGGPDLDAREALVYMRDVLDELAEDAESAQRPSRS